MITLFHKEFRQHGIFVPAMILLCLCFQAGYAQVMQFNRMDVSDGFLLCIAILATALYAGAAAALAYSTEHADNTFLFLRKLPISPQTIAGALHEQRRIHFIRP